MVHVIRAEGLKHMNHFTGDHPYVVVEVKHEDPHHKKTSAQTKPVTAGDTENPYWDEALELEPWHPGEALEFIVYDKGLLGSKTEGKVLLPSELFYPQGFNGMLNISGLPFAKLQVAVQPFGSMVAVGQTTAVASGFQAAAAGSVTYQAPQVYTAAAPTYSQAAPVYMTQAAPTYAEAGAVTYGAPATTFSGQVAAPVTYQAPASTYTAGAAVYQAPPTYAPQAVTYEAPQAVTYEAPQAVTYEAPTPTYAPGVVTYGTPTPTAMTYQPASAMTYTTAASASAMVAQPQVSYGAVQAPMTYGAQPLQAGQMYGQSGVTMGPQKLAISILQAHGLQHMNHFTGDHPYVVCEVKHQDHHARSTKIQTKTVTEGDTMNPFWGETHHIEPWHMGESLEFTVYDKGLLGAKTEGKVTLTPDLFYPNGFSGMVQISGLPHALLHIIVRAMGPSSQSTFEAHTTSEVMQTTSQNFVGVAEAPVLSAKGKSKKLKKGKKQKGCC